MRISQLTIPYCGSLRDFQLELKKKGPSDLHLIYAANEGGKSTLLRAVDAALFGFPHGRRKDVAHFPADSLSGATVVNEDGEELDFRRKKGTKNTLLDAELNSLDDGALDGFLRTVDQSQFSTLFGLTTDVLKEGANSLKGNVATALFSASLGVADLHGRIKQLDAEAKVLVSRAAGRESIKTLQTELKSVLKEQKASIVPPALWKAKQEAFRKAREAVSAVSEDLANGEAELNETRRILSARELAGTIRELETELKALAAVPNLTAEQLEEIEDVEAQLKTAKAAVEKAATKAAHAEAELSKLTAREDLLAKAAEINQLTGGLTLHLQQMKDEQSVRKEVERLRLNLDSSLKNYGLVEGQFRELETVTASNVEEEAELIRLVTASRLKAEQLAERVAEAEGEREEVNLSLASLAEVRAEDVVELELARTVSGLEQVREIARLEKDLTSQRADIDDRLTILGLPEQKRAEILALDTLEPKVLETVAQDRDFLRTEIRNRQEKETELTEELNSLRDRLNSERSAARSIDRAALRAKREERDAFLIDTIQQKAGEVEEVLRRVTELDELADQQFLESERVARIEGLTADVRRQESALERVKTTLAGRQEEFNKLKQNWLQLSQKSCPKELGIEAYEKWSRELEETKDLLRTISQKETQLRDLKEKARFSCDDVPHEDQVFKLEQQKRRLDKERVDSAKIITSRESLITREASTKRKLEKLRKALSDLERKIESQELERGSLRRDLPCSLSELKETQDLATTLEQKERQLQDLSSLVAGFESDVLRLGEGLGFESVAYRLLLEELSRELTKANEQQLKITTQRQVLDGLQSDLKLEMAAKDTLEKRRERLLLPICDILDDGLKDALHKVRNKQQLDSRLVEARAALRSFSGDQDEAGFRKKVDAFNPTELAELQGRQGLRVAELKQERDSLRDGLKTATDEKVALEKAGREAANLNQDAALLRAKIARLTRRFVDLHKAAAFLRAEVHVFQKKEQSPIAKLTGGYFSELTNGEFAGASVQVVDDGTSALIGLRADGRQVGFDEMSEGTGVQLYLALRLAALERHLDSYTPFPLILDDVLMTFDNERTAAVLRALQRISLRTQVIVMTHHEHVLELASPEVNQIRL